MLKAFVAETCKNAMKQQNGQILPTIHPKSSRSCKGVGVIHVKLAEGIELFSLQDKNQNNLTKIYLNFIWK
jgi:hypothetical protein